MEKYEVAVVMKPLLPEDIKKKVISGMESLVTKLGGKLATKSVWGKKHLAYSVKGQEEGYYMFFAMELPAQHLEELHREFSLMSDILRFLVIREDKL